MNKVTHEKKACNVLSINVGSFIPIGKILSRYNFQSSEMYRHLDLKWKKGYFFYGFWNNPKVKFIEKLQCTYMTSDKDIVGLWWKSFFKSRPKSLIFFFEQCSCSLLCKSSILCCVFYGVIDNCSFGLKFSSAWILSTISQANIFRD